MPLGQDDLKGKGAAPAAPAPAEEPKSEPAAEKPAAAKRKKSDASVFVATESGSAEGKKGDLYTFVKGVTRVAKGHELLKLVPDYFEAVSEHIHYDVESATAAPGEKR